VPLARSLALVRQTLKDLKKKMLIALLFFLT
jgi:hypothetical protein